jgi:hypothetical protein
MKLGFYSLLAGTLALDVIPYNFKVWKTRTSKLFVKWDSVGEGTPSDWNVVVKDPNGRVVGVVSDGRDPTNTAREIQRLKPITQYTITVRATNGVEEGPEATFAAFTSPRPIANPRVSLVFQEGVNLEWDAPSGDGADQYRVLNVEDPTEEYFAQSNQLYVQMMPGERKHFQVQSVACGDCINPPNDAWGKPIDLVAVSIPPAPLNVEMTDIEMSNFDYADATITWQNPEVGKWDHVKIEYSPNMPPAKTDTPYYFNSAWSSSFKIEGLYQNTVYTITARFVSNNIEGPAETYTWAIPDASTKKQPKTQNCQVPTYLRPEGLIVKRDVFDHSMNVMWDHPRAKKPENGYRLVFAPFSSISQQKPWFENLDKDATDFRLAGPKYDPYEEYTVSLVALHDEHFDNPHSPDFIASHFTGTYMKNQAHGEYVAPDACCGSERHNSKTSSCCGGSLIHDGEGYLCCRDMPYSASEFKCCSNGRLVSSYDDC